MGVISGRTRTSVKTGGEIIIQTPNGGGWITKLISVTDLLAGTGNNPIKISSVTGSYAQAILANTAIESMYITIVSGTPTVKAGTTLGGAELFDFAFTENTLVDCFKLYTTAGSAYFTVIGGTVNIRIDLKTDYA